MEWKRAFLLQFSIIVLNVNSQSALHHLSLMNIPPRFCESAESNNLILGGNYRHMICDFRIFYLRFHERPEIPSAPIKSDRISCLYFSV